MSAIIPPGCSDEICGTFNLGSYWNVASVPELWSTETTNTPHAWQGLLGINDPITGVANPFWGTWVNTPPGPALINSSINTPGVPIDLMTTGLYTHELFIINNGSFINVQPGTIPYTTILIPGTYVLQITSVTETSLVTGNPCVYNLIFYINNSFNFMPADGSWCDIWGCPNPIANNFNPAANANNGSCDYDVADNIGGCTNDTACNYNANANIDDGSCVFNCYGCTDETALNWSPLATIPCTGAYIFCENNAGQANCCCDYMVGQIEGCMDVFAINYDPTATIENGSCEYNYIGCTDPTADNFNPNVTEPCNGFNDVNQPCVSIINTSLSAGQTPPTATGDNCCCEVYGCTDPNGTNYDPNATYGGVNDDACVYDACKYGCTDPTSTNFDSLATCDDGSCYGGCCAKNNEGEFVLTGWTSSRLNDVTVPGIQGQDVNNPWYPIIQRSQDPDSGKPNGWTSVQQGVYTAYTINNIHYWDYSTNIGFEEDGGITEPKPRVTKFAVQMKNCCPSCLYPTVKEDWSLGHAFPPQIKNNVFIERGITSVFEEHYRLTEVKKLEDLDGYQGGFFNIIT